MTSTSFSFERAAVAGSLYNSLVSAAGQNVNAAPFASLRGDQMVDASRNDDVTKEEFDEPTAPGRATLPPEAMEIVQQVGLITSI